MSKQHLSVRIDACLSTLEPFKLKIKGRLYSTDYEEGRFKSRDHVIIETLQGPRFGTLQRLTRHQSGNIDWLVLITPMTGEEVDEEELNIVIAERDIQCLMTLEGNKS